MWKMKYIAAAVFVILAFACTASPILVYADEDDDRFGFGIQEREREHQDEGSSPTSGVILYVTIGAIVSALAYTAFKIVRSRRATKKLQ